MRRTKSEAKRKGRIMNEEEKMVELVRRTEEKSDLLADGGAKELEEKSKQLGEEWTEVHSNLGSYFWSDSLGCCWDGREKGAFLPSSFLFLKLTRPA
jgi:hypothetical protein